MWTCKQNNKIAIVGCNLRNAGYNNSVKNKNIYNGPHPNYMQLNFDHDTHSSHKRPSCKEWSFGVLLCPNDSATNQRHIIGSWTLRISICYKENGWIRRAKCL